MVDVNYIIEWCLSKERLEIKELREHKMQLLQHIDSMREKEVSLQAQVSRLQEALATEYKKYVVFLAMALLPLAD